MPTGDECAGTSSGHTYACMTLAFGRSVQYIAQKMGYSSTRLVWDTYGYLIDAAGKLDESAILKKLWDACNSQAEDPPAQAEREPVRAHRLGPACGGSDATGLGAGSPTPSQPHRNQTPDEASMRPSDICLLGSRNLHLVWVGGGL